MYGGVGAGVGEEILRKEGVQGCGRQLKRKKWKFQSLTKNTNLAVPA